MYIKLELLRGYIADLVCKNINNLAIDASKIANSTAIGVLSEIQKIIADSKKDDFEVVEEIVLIFEKYHLAYGGRHDF